MEKSDELKEQIAWDAFMEERAKRTPKARLPKGCDNCNVGARWTREDYIKLIQMVHPDVTMEDMSVALRRSLAGIQHALSKLGIAFSTAPGFMTKSSTLYPYRWADKVWASRLSIKKFNLEEILIDEGWLPIYNGNQKVQSYEVPTAGRILPQGCFEESIANKEAREEYVKRRKSGKNKG